MLSTLIIAAATLGQVAYSTTITVDSISDPSGWLTARDWLHVGESFEIDSFVWYEIAPGHLSGNASVHRDERHWIAGTGYGNNRADYVGGPFANSAVDFSTGAASLLLSWDGVPEPLLPQYDDATAIGHVTGFTLLTVGDSTRDGLFDSSDLVEVFIAGRYETGEPATWANGDWNCDGLFRTDDLIVAMQTGKYEQPAAARAIPEPSTLLLAICASLLALGKRYPVGRIEG